MAINLVELRTKRKREMDRTKKQRFSMGSTVEESKMMARRYIPQCENLYKTKLNKMKPNHMRTAINELNQKRRTPISLRED